MVTRMLIVVMGVTVGVGMARAESREPLTYAQFIEKVKSGAIKKVTLQGYADIVGTLVEKKTEKAFSVRRPMSTSEDDLLKEFLKEHNVTVSSGETDKAMQSWYMVAQIAAGCAIPLSTLVLVVLIYQKVNRLVAHVIEQ